MDLAYPEHVEGFRTRVRDFLDRELEPGWPGMGSLPADQVEDWVAGWRRALHTEGLLGLSWPQEYGGAGLTNLEQVVLSEEFARRGVPTLWGNDVFGIKMVGNTLLRHGTEEQRRHFLPRILSGEHVWCQGYSEPEAGSDLAGLRTRAELDGDRWVINGQKIWTSRAHLANWIFVLARTDPNAPRHRGITFLLVPLDQPGIEVRRIEMLTGEGEFCEVFFADAETASGNVVGEIDGGWKVAMTLLGHERGEEAATNPVFFREEYDRLVTMARERHATDDPVLRDRLADAFVRVEVMRFLGARILTGVLTTGELGAESSISKLYWSEYHRDLSDLAIDVLGAAALTPTGRRPTKDVRTDAPGAPSSSRSWTDVFLLNARSGTVYAGSSEIQRNIIAERVLGLPKERAS